MLSHISACLSFLVPIQSTVIEIFRSEIYTYTFKT